MIFQEPKLFGKDADGIYLGRVEEIGTGRESDRLMISNRKPYLWIFSLFNGYRQIGVYDVKNPHDFKEGDSIIVIKKDDKIVEVKFDL